MQRGYIYVRCHESYEKYNVCKLGNTMNIPDRDSQYATAECFREEFKLIYEVDRVDIVEIMLFDEFNYKCNGEIEFYNINHLLTAKKLKLKTIE
jgi:hypothetical protein